MFAELAAATASLLTAAAVVLGVLVLLVTRHVPSALSVLLDLLLAAGLLRLTVELSWHALAATAAIVVVRQLAVAGISTARAARASS